MAKKTTTKQSMSTTSYKTLEFSNNFNSNNKNN